MDALRAGSLRGGFVELHRRPRAASVAAGAREGAAAAGAAAGLAAVLRYRQLVRRKNSVSP